VYSPATYEATGHSYLSLLYFIIVTVMGMYIIMSLFIAILLEKFACQDDAKFELEDQYAGVSVADVVTLLTLR
jgi:hypothetical protein